MNIHRYFERLDAALRRRLVAAPAELRAMAMADQVGWVEPDFATSAAQQQAIHAFLWACRDARLALLGDASGITLDGALSSDTETGWLPPAEKGIALTRALADGGRAGRLLRQSGLKTVLFTRDRDGRADPEGAPAYAELRFRPRVEEREAARINRGPALGSDRGRRRTGVRRDSARSAAATDWREREPHRKGDRGVFGCRERPLRAPRDRAASRPVGSPDLFVARDEQAVFHLRWAA